MDFGTGLDLADDAGALAGTPLYLAPEIVRGEHATEQSDVYSLGVLLFHLVTGSFPVRGETLGDIRAAHARGERRPVRQVTRAVPRRLAWVVERAIAPDPKDRYQSARALAEALRPLGSEVFQRHAVVTAGVVVIVMAVGLSVATRLGRNGRQNLPIVPGGLVEHQIDPDLQRRVQVRGPAVADRWIPCHPRGTRGVALCDLTDSSVRPLRMPKVKGEFSPAMRAVLSPDAQWLAYQWMVEGEKGSSVNVISADGTQDRQLYRSQAILDIQKWTPDGAAVVVREAPARPNQRVLLVFADGTVRELSRLDASVNETDLSPDGRVLLLTRFDGEQHDISAVDLGSGTELWALEGAADDRQALWTPDGRGVAFISDRTGCDSVSFLVLEGSRPAGAPILLKDLGRNRPLAYGFSPDGSYLLSLSHARRTAFRAPLDAAGVATDTPRPLATRCQDDSIGASWDPTGKRIAYLSGGDPMGGAARITIQARDGRIEAEFPAPGSFNVTGRVRWSPGGDELAIVTMGADGGNLLSLMNPRDGVHRELARFPVATRGDWTGEVRWHPSGEVLYYRRGRSIVRQALSSGRSSVVYEPLRGSFGGFDISPIDNALVVGDWIPQSDECVLRIIPPIGAPEDLVKLPGECFGVAWARDAASVLAATFEGPGQRLWRVDRASGAPARVAISSDAFWDLSFSPDGTELLFSAGNPRPNMVILKGFSAAH
jgi:Tol biopolymer transport system component